MASLDMILAAMQNGVTAINNLKNQLATSFPSITVPSTTAPAAGGIAIPTASAFGLVQTSSGGTYRIALLPSS